MRVIATYQRPLSLAKVEALLYSCVTHRSEFLQQYTFLRYDWTTLFTSTFLATVCNGNASKPCKYFFTVIEQSLVHLISQCFSVNVKMSNQSANPTGLQL